jgi:two-component system response regulator NreC
VEDLDTPQPAGPIGVLLAEDHDLVRSGLRALLRDDEDLRVVGEAGDVREAVERVRTLRPEVVLLDLRMPGGPAADVIGAANETGARVLVVTGEDDARLAREALEAGAAGYALKTIGREELLRALRLVAGGRQYLQAELGTQLMHAPSAPEALPDGLTPREAEVLLLLAEGYTNAEIADQLVLSVRTVETHRGRIRMKLGISARAELARYVRERLPRRTSD